MTIMKINYKQLPVKAHYFFFMAGELKNMIINNTSSHIHA